MNNLKSFVLCILTITAAVMLSGCDQVVSRAELERTKEECQKLCRQASDRAKIANLTAGNLQIALDKTNVELSSARSKIGRLEEANTELQTRVDARSRIMRLEKTNVELQTQVDNLTKKLQAAQ